MSSMSEVRGIGAHVILSLSFRNGRMTFCQQEPSAHAPWTNTIVAFSAKQLIVPPPSGLFHRGGDFDNGRLDREIQLNNELGSLWREFRVRLACLSLLLRCFYEWFGCQGRLPVNTGAPMIRVMKWPTSPGRRAAR
jgi:hypothetical protein